MARRFSSSVSIDPQAEIDFGVTIGPFCVVGPNVRIGRDSRLENHVTLSGKVTIGEFNHIFPNAVIGQSAAETSDNQASPAVVIGSHNVIREATIIAPGLPPTTIGNHNLLMACCQIGPECRLHDHITVANCSVLGRQVVVNDHAALSGRVVINAGVVVGSYSFTSIGSHVVHNVPPLVIVEGNPARPRSLNLVGLKRNGFSAEAIRALNTAYRLLFRDRMNIDQARSVLAAVELAEPRVERFINFIESQRSGET